MTIAHSSSKFCPTISAVSTYCGATNCSGSRGAVWVAAAAQDRAPAAAHRIPAVVLHIPAARHIPASLHTLDRVEGPHDLPADHHQTRLADHQSFPAADHRDRLRRDVLRHAAVLLQIRPEGLHRRILAHLPADRQILRHLHRGDHLRQSHHPEAHRILDLHRGHHRSLVGHLHQVRRSRRHLLGHQSHLLHRLEPQSRRRLHRLARHVRYVRRTS
ncbi:hypothetical protein PENSPDRAFT_454592 [Peniophora sp. CONT]|nr:hypothetical protein PENSPDRAFT_454592 [Peniophora sp. CONT]